MKDPFENILSSPYFPQPRYADLGSVKARGSRLAYAKRNGAGAAVLVSPRLDNEFFLSEGILPYGFKSSFGFAETYVGGERMLLAGDSECELPPNAFASLLFFASGGTRVETGMFQIDKLGAVCIINRYTGKLPSGVVFGEKYVSEISCRNGWSLFDGKLKIRIPTEEIRRGILREVPGERGIASLSLVPVRGYPEVPTVTETRTVKKESEDLNAALARAARFAAGV